MKEIYDVNLFFCYRKKFFLAIRAILIYNYNVKLLIIWRSVLNLKKIELQGFKSFADKTEITFEHNVTGIVGPNGCGKSNVIDAVRWVLGEQSPSALRCNRMSDLIFNGTNNRRSQSYCEVSLYLDNADKRYPIDFDEVVITRKLDRSGDSEYLINRQVCRLKDIVDLFRDSGIGKEGYSIIGQGKIEQILASKPEVRRQIFEEAAGISKHKARKIETERKLDRTRDNMSRLNDIIVEIQGQLGPLEKEAKDASKAKELRAELKKLEVTLFLYQCENSATLREKISQKLQKIVTEIETLTTDLERVSRDYTLTRNDIENSDTYANRLREEVTNLMLAAERASGEGRTLGVKMDFLKKEATDIENEILENKTKLSERAELIEKRFLERQAKQEELQIKKEALSKISAQYIELVNSVEQQEKAINLSNDLLLDRMNKKAEVDKNHVTLELERKMLEESISSDKGDYNEKKQLLKLTEKARETEQAKLDVLTKERVAKQEEKDIADKNFNDTDNEQAEFEIKKRELEKRIDNLKFKISLVEEYIKGFEGYDGTIKNLMEDASTNPSLKRKILGTVGQIITVPKDLQTAIEIALGNSIQNIITNDERDAADLIDHLRQHSYGRATFLPMTAVKANPLNREQERVLSEDGVIGVASEIIRYDSKYDAIMSNLLGRIVIVEDKEIGIKISKKYNKSVRLVTLEGDVFATSGAITGGSIGSKAAKILSRESELEALNKSLRSATKELEMVVASIEEVQEEAQELERAVKVIAARLVQIDKDIIDANGKISRLDSEMAIYQADMNKLFAGNEAAFNRIKELDELLELANKSQADIETERISADDYINEAKNKYYEDKQKRDAMNAEVTEATIAVSNAETVLGNIDRDIVTFRDECRKIEQSLVDLDVRGKMNTAELKKVQESLASQRFSDEDQAKLDAMREEIKQIDQHKANLNALLGELDEKKTAVNNALTSTTEKRAREEAALERIDIDIANMSERIQESYGLDYELAKEFQEGCKEDEIVVNFNASTAPNEIASIRRKIERIGPINELAEARFEEESERHNELKQQFDDLAAAEQDLVNIIKELTTEMIEKFTTSFEQINKNFGEVFSELFMGGRAKLELEKGVDVLKAGIEIMAEPPGKKLSNLSLLSGGERALTAIAILFAIIKLKPMPFSILDEIEAALDENNADLYARYLKKFSTVTQFIVVTHRKPTMQLCEVLYGVTMQEKGVSKQVRVKLADAIKQVEEEQKKGDKKD